jgi:hypothetical protein
VNRLCRQLHFLLARLVTHARHAELPRVIMLKESPMVAVTANRFVTFETGPAGVNVDHVLTYEA